MKFKINRILIIMILMCFTLVSCDNNDNNKTKDPVNSELMDAVNLLKFDNKTVDYDGKYHSIYLKGELPEGIQVEYINNNQINPGIYQVSAKLNDTLNRGLNLPTFNATLSIYDTIVVAAMPGHNSEILEAAKPLLKEKGYKLETKTYYDYDTLNYELNDGRIDANFFQHVAYLKNFNEKNGTSLVSAGKIFYFSDGLFGKEIKDINNIPKGTRICLPMLHLSHALALLSEYNLIEIDENKNVDSGLTMEDIVNYNGYEIEIMQDESLSYYQNMDNTIIYDSIYKAYSNGMEVSNLLASYEPKIEYINNIANIIAVKEGNENNLKILALVEVLKSQEIKEYITNTYNGACVPVL